MYSFHILLQLLWLSLLDGFTMLPTERMTHNVFHRISDVFIYYTYVTSRKRKTWSEILLRPSMEVAKLVYVWKLNFTYMKTWHCCMEGSYCVYGCYFILCQCMYSLWIQIKLTAAAWSDITYEIIEFDSIIIFLHFWTCKSTNSVIRVLWNKRALVTLVSFWPLFFSSNWKFAIDNDFYLVHGFEKNSIFLWI